MKSKVGSVDVSIDGRDFEKFLDMPLCASKLVRKSEIFLYSFVLHRHVSPCSDTKKGGSNLTLEIVGEQHGDPQQTARHGEPKQQHVANPSNNTW